MSEEIIEALAEYSSDPEGFVMFAFPWGEPGTDLANSAGPEPWQRWVLQSIAQGLLSIDEAIQLAVTSGHGIGKSALVSWIVWWAVSTCPDTRGVVTANTENQLKTKTWVEVAKWYRLFIAKDLFKVTATAIFSADPEHEKTWRIDMVPWSERNTEAFAGLHNQGSRILVVFDEASAIPDPIWEVTEGALTDEDTEIIWCAFGNPTRNQGRFRECFSGGRFERRWKSRAVDSRTVSFTNKKQIAKWIEDYGEDHDFVRVRVKGEFPRVDAESFIPLETAREAMGRVVEPQGHHPLIIGVDVARFGDNMSALVFRRGLDASTIPPMLFQGLDTMQLAARIAFEATNRHAAAVMVDVGGVGGGVADRLRQLGVPVFEVQFGGKPDGLLYEEPEERYANKRTEIWASVRSWLARGSIPDNVQGLDHDPATELSAPTYGFDARDRITLESKKDMRRRGVISPDWADALACTFAFPVYQPGRDDTPPSHYDDYDPFSEEHLHATA